MKRLHGSGMKRTGCNGLKSYSRKELECIVYEWPAAAAAAL